MWILLFTDGNTIYANSMDDSKERLMKEMDHEAKVFINDLKSFEAIEMQEDRISLIHNGDLYLWQIRKVGE